MTQAGEVAELVEHRRSAGMSSMWRACSWTVSSRRRVDLGPVEVGDPTGKDFSLPGH